MDSLPLGFLELGAVHLENLGGVQAGGQAERVVIRTIKVIRREVIGVGYCDVDWGLRYGLLEVRTRFRIGFYG